ncbi:MAG: hypothetical protein ACM3PY_04860 [Omnitrophica WOR_2 bacterium]
MNTTYTTVLHPTAGFIPDIARDAPPGMISSEEASLLRDLAKRVAEIANEPEQAEKRRLWLSHNALEPVRPMLLVFPEDAWSDVLPPGELNVADPFWRQVEWYLKHLIYRADHLPDDFVIEPEFYITLRIDLGNWGLFTEKIYSGQDKGAWIYDPALKDPGAIDRLTEPAVRVDEAYTQRCFQAAGDVLGDILPVRVHGFLPAVNLVGEAAELRGLEALTWDLYDRPEWVHKLMSFISAARKKQLIYLVEKGYLSLNNRNHYTDSGGYGYTDELPGGEFTGQVRLKDLWGFGVAQEFSWVGPAQHELFLLDYQLPLLECFGLVSYGCCEPYTHKFEMLKRRVPRLRRISVSPWCDLRTAAQALQDRFVLSWKFNPAPVVSGLDEDALRLQIREGLQITRGCVTELILKDLFSVRGRPERVERFARIAREEIDSLK